MAFNYQQAPFWDWARSFEDSGAGVDHPRDHPFEGPPGPPPHPPHPAGDFFGWWGPRMRGREPGPWGRGPRGRHSCRHDRDGSPERSPSGERGERTDKEPPPGPRHPHGRHGCRGGWGGRRHRGPPPFGGFGGPGAMPFDLNGLVEALTAHSIGQAFRNYAEQSGFVAPQDGQQRTGETTGDEAETGFKPPIDVFTAEKEYILHAALPGAKKEDVGVNWDSDKGVLNLAGVVYRQGDEEFLKNLTQSERKVGVFQRTVKLPPTGEKEEVDSDVITAKLEDGVLVVTVPKIEKEWTEVKRVDIE